MKKIFLYLFIISLALSSFGLFLDSGKTRPNILVQTIELIATTIIVFSALSGFSWIIIKIRGDKYCQKDC